MATNVVQSHQFGSNACHSTWKGKLRFEVQSLLGRAISPKRRKASAPLLQVGAGGHPFPHFENLDFYFSSSKKMKIVGHDLRFALPYEDNSFEGVFSEHTLEHLYPADSVRLIGEIYRVLKPGGIFRCIVPDLDKYVRFYNGEVPNDDFKQYSSGCEAMWCLTQNWFHQSVWNAEMMMAKMREAGFSSAEEKSFGVSQDSRLAIDLQERSWESLYVEGVK